MARLINRTPLTFTRKSSAGYYDDSGEWVDGFDDEFIHIRCSLQPYKRGKSRLVLPEGIQTRDAFVVFTSSELRVADQLTGEVSDKTTINSQTYEVSDVEDWSFHSDLRSSHWQYLLIREDANANGS